MNRSDNSKYVLYIEPKLESKLNEPVCDELTDIMELAISKAKKGSGNYSKLDDVGDGYDWVYKGKINRIPSFNEGRGYKGFHITECGERSTNVDYLLENGMITNSLAPFYLKWYRNSIPETEINKVKKLVEFYIELQRKHRSL